MSNIQEDLIAFNSRNNPFYNDKGYADPTAYQGIEAAAASEYRARFDAIAALIHTVKYIFAGWRGSRSWAESPCGISRAATSTSEEAI